MTTEGDLAGKVIAERYQVVRLLGRGGMGAVYEARHLGTLKRCAVKVLNAPELAGDYEVVKRFYREARASGLIESENVVAAFDCGVDADRHVYYAMEYLEGEDLAQTLERVGSLREETALKVALQAAEGLSRAHALGVIHRDVKPANLFLSFAADGNTTVKILDFGVAKAKLTMLGESADSLTHGGSLLGTPEYMSPEQLRRASAIDETTDVWSLGMVLFRCLTGTLPWSETETLGELLSALLTAPLPSIQDRAPWVSPQVAGLVGNALARDVRRRPRNAEALRDALRELLAGGTRLHRSELVAPTEDERKIHAERLPLAPTLRDTSDVPLSAVRSTAPRTRAVAERAGFALGIAAIVATAAWVIVGRSRPVSGPEALGAGRSPTRVPPAVVIPLPTPPDVVEPNGAARPAKAAANGDEQAPNGVIPRGTPAKPSVPRPRSTPATTQVASQIVPVGPAPSGNAPVVVELSEKFE